MLPRLFSLPDGRQAACPPKTQVCALVINLGCFFVQLHCTGMVLNGFAADAVREQCLPFFCLAVAQSG
jgi:hypothetical protein